MSGSDDSYAVKLPWLDEMRLHFAQEADTCDEEQNVQELDILVTRGDAASGFFYRLSTARWAIDDASELVALLARVQVAIAAASNTAQVVATVKPASKSRATKAT